MQSNNCKRKFKGINAMNLAAAFWVKPTAQFPLALIAHQI
jgi:hypothetical protein